MIEEQLGRISNLDKRPIVPQALMDAYIEGNVTLPTHDMGISIFLAEKLCADPGPDLELFARTAWSDDQFEYVKRTMNTAHGARHIPAGTGDQIGGMLKKIQKVRSDEPIPIEAVHVIPDYQVRQLWSHEQRATLLLLGVLSGLNKDYLLTHKKIYTDAERESVSALIGKRISHPVIAAKVRAVVGSLAATLRSPEGKTILEQIRGASDNRRHGIPGKKRESMRPHLRDPLLEELQVLMLKRCIEDSVSLDQQTRDALKEILS